MSWHRPSTQGGSIPEDRKRWLLNLDPPWVAEVFSLGGRWWAVRRTENGEEIGEPDCLGPFSGPEEAKKAAEGWVHGR